MNAMKKMTALLLAAAVMLPAYACATDNSSSLNAEFSGDAENSSDSDSGDSANDSSSADDSTGGDAETDPDTVIDEYGQPNHALVFEQPDEDIVANDSESDPVVTTIRGDDGNYYTPVTDINGATVTEPGGEVQTEVYTGTTNAASYPEDNYQPDFKTYQAYWLDISQREDYVFDGNLLEFEIEIPETTKDGVYPVEIYYTDFSNYDAESLKDIVTNVGYVCVNSDEPEAAELTDGQINLTAETVSAKPGETVRMNIRIDNNTGIVAFVIRMHYDANAMTILRAAAGSDLGQYARLTTRTLDDDT